MTKRELIDALLACTAPDDTPVVREFDWDKSNIEIGFVDLVLSVDITPEHSDARLFQRGTSAVDGAVLTLNLY